MLISDCIFIFLIFFIRIFHSFEFLYLWELFFSNQMNGYKLMKTSFSSENLKLFLSGFKNYS